MGARRAGCQLCCGRGLKSLRSLFLSQNALKPLLPTVAEPLPTGLVTRAMNREAIQQVPRHITTPCVMTVHALLHHCCC